MKKILLPLFGVTLSIVSVCVPLGAQTTAFTYQGSLSTAGSPANGNHDFEFVLFDSLLAGTQVGSTFTRTDVAVSNGLFAVSLDFGSQFPGANRFLEVRVRITGGGAFTPLAPRQQINSEPYAIKSLVAETAATATNSTQLGGVAANLYVVTTDPRMTDPRAPTAGSASYIQNQNSAPQSSSNFSISGNGTAGGTLSANVVNSASQYNLGGARIIGVTGLFPTSQSSTLAGIGAGANAFGSEGNSFFGKNAGLNTSIDGTVNSFFGASAGLANQSGDGNSFFGIEAGMFNQTGSGNSFFGNSAGVTNVIGLQNTAIGTSADFGSNGLVRATAIGFRALVTQNDSMVLGAINGVNGSTNDTRVGIGTTAPAERIHVVGNGLVTGTLTGGTVNATTQYNLNGVRILRQFGIGNLFIGFQAGEASVASGDPNGNNTFVGGQAGRNVLATVTGGSANSFFGFGAGDQVTTGNRNSIFGHSAGALGETGNDNSFFGQGTGINTTSSSNSFFGSSAGRENTSGTNNAFFGKDAGRANATSSNNSFFGASSGLLTTGAANSFFGSGSGQDNVDGADNAFFGVNTGRGNTSGNGNSYFGRLAGRNTNTGSNNTMVGFSAGAANNTGSGLTMIGANTNVSSDGLSFATAIGAGAVVSSSDTIQIGRGIDTVNVPGKIKLNILGSAGATELCRNASAEIATCSSSGRYKSNISPFSSGLSLINRLRPVSFNWLDGGMRDLGLVAEEVAAAEPLLATMNDKGQVEGVRYDRLAVVLVNAIKEQQAQIEAQTKKISQDRQKEIEAQRKEIDVLREQVETLKTLVCATNATASICKPKVARPGEQK